MSEEYICRRCGKAYSAMERQRNMFCQKCGAYLTLNAFPEQGSTPHADMKTEHDFKEVSNLPIRYLPETHRKQLIESYEQGSRIIRSHGCKPEPIQTSFCVEEHRWYWKPKDVKFILVAESHVYTGEKEVSVKINPNRLPSDVPKDIPLNFVKLVYCLGYGEPSILDRPEKIENNAGTRQYINLFRDCIRFTDNTASTNLQWKARLLKAFREKGLWLLDASCHACYLGKNERLPTEIVNRIVPISWNDYVKQIIDGTSINPEHVWIIGKGLHDLLSGKYARGSNWIYQPNARIKYAEKRVKQQEMEKAIHNVIHS